MPWRTKGTPRPVFRDKRAFRIHAEAGEPICVGLLTCSYTRVGLLRHFLPSRRNSSDWLSPKGNASEHTAAVPSGIRTRLSCSAVMLARHDRHAAVYQIVGIIITRLTWTVKRRIQPHVNSSCVTFLQPCKKVTKEDGIGEALTAKPIQTTVIILPLALGFEPPSPMYLSRRKS